MHGFHVLCLVVSQLQESQICPTKVDCGVDDVTCENSVSHQISENISHPWASMGLTSRNPCTLRENIWTEIRWHNIDNSNWNWRWIRSWSLSDLVKHLASLTPHSPSISLRARQNTGFTSDSVSSRESSSSKFWNSGRDFQNCELLKWYLGN